MDRVKLESMPGMRLDREQSVAAIRDDDLPKKTVYMDGADFSIPKSDAESDSAWARTDDKDREANSETPANPADELCSGR